MSVASEDQLAAFDWSRIQADLDGQGWAVLASLLSFEACDALTALYNQDERFRSTVVMARHGYGRGQYKYFSYPLPSLIETLRSALYPRLATIANGWHERMSKATWFPADHAAYLDHCHANGQVRPTPLLLQYGPGDYNCLHQDLYGDEVFPIQLAVLLDEPGRDFDGGEFVMTEQRPRMQTRAMVVPLHKGDGVLFAVNTRPVRGARGDHQVKLRHGVSELRRGRRHTAGVIFHDAR